MVEKKDDEMVNSGLNDGGATQEPAASVNRYELLTEEELGHLREIDVLLHEANEYALSLDGYCKSSEGFVSVSFGNHWDRIPGEDGRIPPRVEIYSYLLGPYRNHTFDNTLQALETVRVWHHNAMLMVSEEELMEFERLGNGGELKGVDLGRGLRGEPLPDPYVEIEREREERWRRGWDEIEGELDN